MKIARLTVVSALLVATPAMAQDILDAPMAGQSRRHTWRAQDSLEADLRAPMAALPGGVAPLARGDMFRARNRIVTDNVLGGRGFRGTVGYTAADDFRGATGSDDLYQFRAGSAWSDASMIQLGNTYQRLRFGQSANLLGIDRTSAGAMGPSTRMANINRAYTPLQRVEQHVRLDDTSRLSTREATSLLSAEPVSLGQQLSYERDETTGGVRYFQEEVRVSESLGISAFEVMDSTSQAQRGWLSRWDEARLMEDINENRPIKPGGAFAGRFADLATVNQMADAPGSVDLREQLKVSTLDQSPYQEILQRIKDRQAQQYGAVTGVDVKADPEADQRLTEELDAEIDALRRQLYGVPSEDTDAGDGEGASDTPGAAVPPAAEMPDLDINDVLRHGETLEHYYGANDTRINEILQDAEQLLRGGEYFKAESRFAHALRLSPQNPLANAGVVNAQIGAGLYRPAASRLNALFVGVPTMIDVAYADGLIPNRPRLNSVVADLRERLVNSEDPGPTALLLAYVGRLLGDEVIIRQGLDRMQVTDPDGEMAPLLEELWLAPDESPEG